ncbi:hypothetical protein PInf_019389 [Phytophthora infestans]|nr:hypothetical protein PInf_019389 [Phytophthora infestans]
MAPGTMMDSTTVDPTAGGAMTEASGSEMAETSTMEGSESGSGGSTTAVGDESASNSKGSGSSGANTQMVSLAASAIVATLVTYLF